ncbi:MAG: MBL fold metallo-hydrolase [Polyangiaceae bacterium]|nr:MBL fold metallo-hydrolase [Polyangiaceae bacterium]
MFPLSSRGGPLLLLGCLVACAGAPSANPPTSAVPATSAVSLRYLGVAGWQVNAAGHTLLVDPYFTRHRGEDGEIARTDEEAVRRLSPAQADVVLVEHSHYDHLLDVPSVAQRTGATVVGTESTANVSRAAGLPTERVVVASGGERLAFGPFVVQVKKGLHSLIGMPNVPIAPNPRLPMRVSDYGEGNTLQYLVAVGGHRVMFVGSANFVEAELTGARADVVVLATGLRAKVPSYTCRVLTALGRPHLVLANHFDDFGGPLAPGVPLAGLDADDRADLEAFRAEVHACTPEAKVLVPAHLQSFEL